MVTKLKTVRTEMGISQLELAMMCSKESGKSPSRWTIQLVESGYRTPSLEEIRIISKCLGASPKEIFPNYNAKQNKKNVTQGKSA